MKNSVRGDMMMWSLERRAAVKLVASPEVRPAPNLYLGGITLRSTGAASASVSDAKKEGGFRRLL
jgi:hypothetical protein